MEKEELQIIFRFLDWMVGKMVVLFVGVEVWEREVEFGFGYIQFEVYVSGRDVDLEFDII